MAHSSLKCQSRLPLLSNYYITNLLFGMDPANIELANTPVPFNILLKENPIYFLIEEVYYCTVQLQILHSTHFMNEHILC